MKTSYRTMCQTAILLFILACSCKNVTVNTTGSIPRSLPEAEGVSPEGIMTFLDSVAVSKHEFHSIMILRHGKVIAEGWWKPYGPDLRHTLYSTSKSFTSTAVGFAVTEKRLKVNDKVISFFPEDLPDTVDPYLAELTVKDLLTMSVGQDPDPTFSIRANDTNWVRSFLALPIKNKPGTKFLYNSMATYMLSAIVQKVTGEKVIDYLTPRLFDPLGIQGMDWEVDPKGINTGGWGLRIKTEDMAKFGQLYLQKGKWYGNQIIPSAWVEEATTFKIDQAPDEPQTKKDSSDWKQGYCYQFWRCRNNAFRADGAFGQYIIVIPDKDAVIAITSESPDMQSEINMVWRYLLPAFTNEALPENKSTDEKLKKMLGSLQLRTPEKSSDSITTPANASKTFILDPNEMLLETISFDFTAAGCQVTLRADSTDYKLNFGEGEWIAGVTNKVGPNLIKSGSGSGEAKVSGSYGWKDSHTLELILRYIESPHHETYTCRFDDHRILMSIAPSNGFGKQEIVIKGKEKL